LDHTGEYMSSSASRVVLLSSCVPAVRTYCVEVSYFAEDQTFNVHPFPVLAIQTAVRNVFFHHKDGQELPLTMEEAVERGWEFIEDETLSSFIIYTEEYGLIPHDDCLMDCGNTIQTVVYCYWPYDRHRDLAAINDTADELRPILKERIAKAQSSKSSGA